MDDFETLKDEVDQELRPAFEIAVIIFAFAEAARQKGYTSYQQSDFNTPMGVGTFSPEEELHQDLVWIYHLLPPHDVFDQKKADSGYYRQLKFDYLNNFWENYDPEQDKQIKFKKTYTPRSYPKTHITTKPPSTLKAIRKHLAEGDHGI